MRDIVGIKKENTRLIAQEGVTYYNNDRYSIQHAEGKNRSILFFRGFMYRERREQRRKLLKHFIWWHPVILLLIMFVLGACSGAKKDNYQFSTSAAHETLHTVAETTAAASRPSGGGPESAIYVEPVPTSESLKETEAESTAPETLEAETDPSSESLPENGNYTSKEEVALYLHLYGKLPPNYITKRKAEERGWDSGKGNLGDVLPGMSIGGSGFGNYEGLLPAESGRKYYECDIDYEGGYRNSKRIVYSNDGLIFYTEDHYKTFEQLY